MDETSDMVYCERCRTLSDEEDLDDCGICDHCREREDEDGEEAGA